MRVDKLLIILVGVFVPTIALADLVYNPEHDAALQNLKPAQCASINMQYQCGKFSLIISAYATESDINGRRALVTGKIVSEDETHDISKSLTKAISRDDILASQMSIACNANKGAFEMKFFSTPYTQEKNGDSIVNIFADGTVEGSRAF